MILLAVTGIFFGFPKMSHAESVTSVVNAGGQDAYVRFMMPMNNFGGESDLWAGGAQASDPRLHNFFIQFQLPSIPSGATINSANIQLYFYQEVIVANDLELQVAAANSSWNENSITWNNKPGSGATQTATLVQAGAFGWKNFDITSLARRWYSGSQANYGVEIYNPGENSVVKKFYSGQSGTGLEPRLVIDYATSTNPTDPSSGTNNGQTSSGTNNRSSQQTGTTGTTSDGTTSTVQDIAKSITTEAIKAVSFATLVSKEISNTAAPVVLIASAAALTAASALASIFSVLLSQVSIKELFLIIFNYFVSLINYRRRNKFGLVYDQVSNNPVPAAIVRLFDFKTMKMIDSTLTDFKGHFFFTVKSGEYVITVIKTGFVFPSHAIGKSEKFIGRAYLGQTIRIQEDASIINVKIPLDRTVKSKAGLSIFARLVLSNLIRYVVLTAGSAVTLYILYYDYSRSHLLVACLYLVLWMIELLIQNRDLRFNQVIDKNSKQAIDLATIRIFGTNGRLIQTCISDFRGKFIAKTREKGDKITIERVGYQTLEQQTHQAGILEGKKFYLSRA